MLRKLVHLTFISGVIALLFGWLRQRQENRNQEALLKQGDQMRDALQQRASTAEARASAAEDEVGQMITLRQMDGETIKSLRSDLGKANFEADTISQENSELKAILAERDKTIADQDSRLTRSSLAFWILLVSILIAWFFLLFTMVHSDRDIVRVSFRVQAPTLTSPTPTATSSLYEYIRQVDDEHHDLVSEVLNQSEALDYLVSERDRLTTLTNNQNDRIATLEEVARTSWVGEYNPTSWPAHEHIMFEAANKVHDKRLVYIDRNNQRSFLRFHDGSVFINPTGEPPVENVGYRLDRLGTFPGTNQVSQIWLTKR